MTALTRRAALLEVRLQRPRPRSHRIGAGGDAAKGNQVSGPVIVYKVGRYEITVITDGVQNRFKAADDLVGKVPKARSRPRVGCERREGHVHNPYNR